MSEEIYRRVMLPAQLLGPLDERAETIRRFELAQKMFDKKLGISPYRTIHADLVTLNEAISLAKAKGACDTEGDR